MQLNPLRADVLIRPRAWWYNKVPLTLTTLIVLVDGGRIALIPLFGLVAVVLCVCCVANYGYALNELYDVREDAAIGRANAAARLGTARTVQIVVGSAVAALVLSFLCAGVGGAALTAAELCIPLAYSHPWLRLKERKWWGVLCDATAAHVYPAMLALAAAQHLDVGQIPAVVWACAGIWALAAGLRGILSHQMHTAEQDSKGGLYTVAHQFGRSALSKFVVFVLLPIEVVGFGAFLVLYGVGQVAWAIGLIYLTCELLKTLSGRFRVIAFDPEGQPYIPFVEENFYKAWGPLLLPLDGLSHDIWLVLLIPAYVWLFRPHAVTEWARVRALIAVGTDFIRSCRISGKSRKMTGMRSLGPRGIVTLADAAYYPGLIKLYESVQDSLPIPVVCFDAGLTDDQRREAGHYPNLVIQPLPDEGLVPRIRSAFENAAPLGKKIKRVWPLWICPALIAAAPFRQVFWMDSDAVVLGDLRVLFGMLETGPVFTPENNAPEQTPNKPELYQHLPIARNFDPLEPKVNAGISGWDLSRDHAVLSHYIHVVERACEDPKIAQSVSWHDQGALIWAIQRSGLEHRVLDNTSWNLCVKNSPVVGACPPWGPDFIPALRQLAPDANILHWNGMAPPWSS